MDEQGVVSRIRKVLPEELESFKHSDRLEWVQLCPFCNAWVASLVDHVKSSHRDKSSRQIRTACPYEECGKMVVDVKNHMKKVHVKLKNFQCEECDAKFITNYQRVQHMESVHINLKVECDECGGLFKTTTLQGHIRRIHRGKKPNEPCTEDGCDKVFGSKSDLERHVMSVHMNWRAPCPECGLKVRMDMLMRHVKTAHRGIHNIKCDECGQGFQNQKLLVRHVQVQHKGTFIYCRATSKKGIECGKILHSEEGLINHIECKHITDEDNVQIVCPECPIQVPACYLLHHIVTVHTNSGQMECLVKSCKIKMSDVNSLRKHVEGHHKALGLEWCRKCSQFVIQLGEHIKLQHEAELSFQPLYGVCEGQLCSWEGCNFMASGPTNLEAHVKSKHKTFVKCEKCDKKFENIEEHIKTSHPLPKSLPCDFESCVKFFSSKKLLRLHKKTHTRGKVECEECGAMVAKIRQHMRFVHEKDLRYPCDQSGCDLRFPSKVHYLRHVKQVHQKIKDKCNICKKRVSALKKHMQLVHDKIRNHPCQECDKSFQSKQYLKKHVSLVHIGLKEECSECGKMVKDVKSHIRVSHDKIANFECDKCGLKCVTNTNLQKHISSQHLRERIKCPQCDKIVSLASFGQHLRKKHSDRVKTKFLCDQCDQFFCDRSSLAKHVRHVHMEVREECNICGLMTKDLKRHIKNTDCGRIGFVPRKTKKIKQELIVKEEPNDNWKVGEDFV